MALSMDYDPVTGIELAGMYYRIIYHNANETDIQMTVSGYASEKAFREMNARPIIPSRNYTFDYDKAEFSESKPYQYMYELLKTHEDFKDATDVYEDGQEPTT